MKKLVFAAVVAGMVGVVNASAFSWTISGFNKVYTHGTATTPSTTLMSGMAYLFCADAYAQATLLDAGQTLDTSKAVASATLADGAIAATPFNYGTDGTEYNFYLVVQDTENNIFASTSVAQTGQEGKSQGVITSALNSNGAVTKWEKGGTFDTAGWYEVEAVPEPFSGSLALLGLGVVALRRRMKKQKKA